MSKPASEPTGPESLRAEHQQIVAALSQENAKLLLARQRASGAEIEVLTAEREMTENADCSQAKAALSHLYELEMVAKLELSMTERRIEDLESRMAAVISGIAAQND